MAYDETLATRVRGALGRRRGVVEKRMFGGLAFLLNGNMCCGVVGEDLMLRLGEEGAADALGKRHVRPMDFTGKVLKSMVYVGPAGLRKDGELEGWVRRAAEFAGTLKARARGARAAPRRTPRA